MRQGNSTAVREFRDGISPLVVHSQSSSEEQHLFAGLQDISPKDRYYRARLWIYSLMMVAIKTSPSQNHDFTRLFQKAYSFLDKLPDITKHRSHPESRLCEDVVMLVFNPSYQLIHVKRLQNSHWTIHLRLQEAVGLNQPDTPGRVVEIEAMPRFPNEKPRVRVDAMSFEKFFVWTPATSSLVGLVWKIERHLFCCTATGYSDDPEQIFSSPGPPVRRAAESKDSVSLLPPRPPPPPPPPPPPIPVLDANSCPNPSAFETASQQGLTDDRSSNAESLYPETPISTTSFQSNLPPTFASSSVAASSRSNSVILSTETLLQVQPNIPPSFSRKSSAKTLSESSMSVNSAPANARINDGQSLPQSAQAIVRFSQDEASRESTLQQLDIAQQDEQGLTTNGNGCTDVNGSDGVCSAPTVTSGNPPEDNKAALSNTLALVKDEAVTDTQSSSSSSTAAAFSVHPVMTKSLPLADESASAAKKIHSECPSGSENTDDELCSMPSALSPSKEPVLQVGVSINTPEPVDAIANPHDEVQKDEATRVSPPQMLQVILSDIEHSLPEDVKVIEEVEARQDNARPHSDEMTRSFFLLAVPFLDKLTGLQKELERHPESVLTPFYLFWCYFNAGLYGEAEQLLDFLESDVESQMTDSQRRDLVLARVKWMFVTNAPEESIIGHLSSAFNQFIDHLFFQLAVAAFSAMLGDFISAQSIFTSCRKRFRSSPDHPPLLRSVNNPHVDTCVCFAGWCLSTLPIDEAITILDAWQPDDILPVLDVLLKESWTNAPAEFSIWLCETRARARLRWIEYQRHKANPTPCMMLDTVTSLTTALHLINAQELTHCLPGVLLTILTLALLLNQPVNLPSWAKRLVGFVCASTGRGLQASFLWKISCRIQPSPQMTKFLSDTKWKDKWHQMEALLRRMFTHAERMDNQSATKYYSDLGPIGSMLMVFQDHTLPHHLAELYGQSLWDCASKLKGFLDKVRKMRSVVTEEKCLGPCALQVRHRVTDDLWNRLALYTTINVRQGSKTLKTVYDEVQVDMEKEVALLRLLLQDFCFETFASKLMGSELLCMTPDRRPIEWDQ